MNNIGVFAVVLISILIIASITLREFYYSSARQRLTMSLNMSLSVLQNYYFDGAVNFSEEIDSVVAEYSDKDIAELMIIDDIGNVALTSSGFLPTKSEEMPDFAEAFDNEGNGYFVGRNDNGQKVMALSSFLPNNNDDYSAIRVISCIDELDSRIFSTILIMIAVGVAILLFMFVSGMYFVKSIVIPVHQISNVTKKYALGDFSARVKTKSTDEIGELCGTINNMAAELENAESMKNEFISSVSHELRTPLTAIKGWAETVESMPSDTAIVGKGMRIIGNESERLSKMVDELLDFSRIQNGRFTLEEKQMDILAELGDAILMYGETAKNSEIEIIYDEPEMLPTVFGDANRIRQVFINVIDNAIKYSDKGGLVSINATSDNNGFIVIDVSDTGCGIKSADLPKIKTKFFKANYTRRGSGIGLAVADEIIAMHGGTITLFSEWEVGTTVTIKIPYEKHIIRK